MVESTSVSMDTRYRHRTSARDRMLAREVGLYQIFPNNCEVPSHSESCGPPLVRTVSVEALRWMLERSSALRNTETVDWLSSRTQVEGMGDSKFWIKVILLSFG